MGDMFEEESHGKNRKTSKGAEKGKANVTDLRVKLYKKNQKLQTPPPKQTKIEIEENWMIMKILMMMTEIHWKKLTYHQMMNSILQKVSKLHQIASSKNQHPCLEWSKNKH